jgi:hypothetical protein
MADPKTLPEVTRFVVKLPTRFASQPSELRERLQSSFPSRAFSLELCDDADLKRIALVPVMEDAQGRAHLCRLPERSLIARMHQVINDFFMATRIRPA